MPDLRVSFPKPCDEKWEAMTPSGCDRVCARCDQVVHDLAEYTLDEAEALVRANPGTCVRAEIGADGAVKLKPGRGGRARRMVIAAAATAGLLAAATPALAKQAQPRGSLSGNALSYASRVRVTASGADGRTYRATSRPNGRFRIGSLPAGTYTLRIVPDCGEAQTIENVVVRQGGETVLPPLTTENQCIVIGLLRIEDDRG